jgi:ADP-heptose:LPS heptosyltransferase
MILFAPFAARSPSLNGQPSPKDYPFARELAQLLEKDYELVQVGGGNDEQVCKDFRPNLSFHDLGKLIAQSQTGVCVDSYLQHAYWYFDRRAIVLLGPSDPLIFSHDIHLNLLKDRSYLRPNQFDLYYTSNYKPEAFVSPQQILDALGQFTEIFEK